ncbi:MetQ/NlpA family ABC transporter substrate-binding protein [Lacticaseibacillus nasuensis]|uniref:MetQ/NlpA family ABC transporter substrate-binding protein n=1 Tax=Lacticaseibacillus nasuensis TaxID=944671 RepID=UPI0022471F1C|nr:MetQ/NlpA family ABC transporter substrate-binding protein [Lacticaseibacillus nasuensis]MCX2455236.1 MetQ/NlpA family ABC transporter substrate-binding protein [Lacticaseibacillus nasuensis]
MKKVLKTLALAAVLSLGLVLAACGKSNSSASSKSTTVKLGVVGSDNRLWQHVAQKLKKQGITLKIVEFSDYNTPNTALADGDVDLNAFQHQFFLDDWNKKHNQNLTSIGKTVIAPMAIFSKKITKLSQIKKGDTVSIPNDATNEARALELLKANGFITFKPGTGNLPTPTDIKTNKLGLKIKLLDAAQLPTTLQDVDASVINEGVALNAKLDFDKALDIEKVTKSSIPWINIIVAKKKDVNNKVYKKVVKAYQTQDTKDYMKKLYGKTEIPAWDVKF